MSNISAGYCCPIFLQDTVHLHVFNHTPFFDMVTARALMPHPNFLHETTFELWAGQTLTGTTLDAVHKLTAKVDDFALAFANPMAYRTSNMIDREMIPLDRWLITCPSDKWIRLS